jgi:hypothetical protein
VLCVAAAPKELVFAFVLPVSKGLGVLPNGLLVSVEPNRLPLDDFVFDVTLDVEPKPPNPVEVVVAAVLGLEPNPVESSDPLGFGFVSVLVAEPNMPPGVGCVAELNMPPEVGCVAEPNMLPGVGCVAELNMPPGFGCVAAALGVEPNSPVPAGFGFGAPWDGKLNNPPLFDLVSAGVWLVALDVELDNTPAGFGERGGLSFFVPTVGCGLLDAGVLCRDRVDLV